MTTATLTEISAIRLSTALAACEYSHRTRSRIQSSGNVDQFLVFRLTGKVAVQNMTWVPAMQANATAAAGNDFGSDLEVTASARVDRNAPATMIPANCHPR